MSSIVLVWLKIELIKNIEMIQRLTVAMPTIFATFLALDLEVILVSNDGKSEVLLILLTLDADFILTNYIIRSYLTIYVIDLPINTYGEITNGGTARYQIYNSSRSRNVRICVHSLLNCYVYICIVGLRAL